MKTIIVIPTYNEYENITPLLKGIFAVVPGVFVLVVDDNSPDGTASEVKKLQKEFQNLLLLERREKQGLGVAYRAGFEYALTLHPDTKILGMMDADFYHDPKDLPRLLDEVQKTDMVIGSVYAKGGKTPDSFGFWRHFLSRGGNLYCRILLGYPLTDWTNAFVMIRTSALAKVNLNALAAKEFAFIFGLKYILLKSGASWKDIGVIADERTSGESKITSRTIKEALYAPWGLRFGKLNI